MSSPRESLPALVDRIVERFVPQRIVLFGSLARGDETADSDIDLLVVFDHVDFEHKREVGVELRRATADLRVSRNFVVTDVAELERLGDLVGYVYRPALREGVVVYERADA